MRWLIWASAIFVLLGAGAAVILLAVDLVAAVRVFGSGDPKLLAGAISETIISYVLLFPFVASQTILALWAMKKLREAP